MGEYVYVLLCEIDVFRKNEIPVANVMAVLGDHIHTRIIAWIKESFCSAMCTLFSLQILCWQSTAKRENEKIHSPAFWIFENAEVWKKRLRRLKDEYIYHDGYSWTL